MRQERNLTMTMASAIGILLVVFGHSGFEEPDVMLHLKGLHRWIYSFHMPLFIFVSGYLYTLTNPDFFKVNVGKFIKKKFLRLAVPYLVLGIVVFCIKYLFASISHVDREFSLSNFLLMFIAPDIKSSTIGYLWFIATLFFMFCVVSILPLLRLDLRKPQIALVLMAACWTLKFSAPDILLFKINAILWYLPFFVSGILFNVYEQKLAKFINGNYGLTILYFVLSVLGCLCINTENELLGFFSDIIFGYIGILLSFSVCNIILKFCNNTLPGGWLYVLTRSFTIYLLSWFPQYITKFVVVNILHLHWSICVITMFAAGVVVPLIIYWLLDKYLDLNKHKLLKLCIGG